MLRKPVSFAQKYLIILQKVVERRAVVALLWVRVAPLISAESYWLSFGSRSEKWHYTLGSGLSSGINNEAVTALP